MAAKVEAGRPFLMHDLLLDLSRRGHGSYVLVASAQFERALQEMIEMHMPNLSNTLREKLFKDRGPFANFSSKIDTVYAMGDIDARTRHDLHVLRALRNEFAHPKKAEVHFDLDDMRSLLKNFRDYVPERDRLVFLGEKIDELWAAIGQRLDTSRMVKALRDHSAKRGRAAREKY